jgi:hypothetical protein
MQTVCMLDRVPHGSNEKVTLRKSLIIFQKKTPNFKLSNTFKETAMHFESAIMLLS